MSRNQEDNVDDDLPLPSQHNNPPCKLAHSDPPLSNLPSCHTHRCTPTASYGRLRSNWRGGCLHHQDAPARNCQDGSVAHWHPTSPSHSSQSGWCTLPSFHPHYMAAVRCQEMWKVLSKPPHPHRAGDTILCQIGCTVHRCTTGSATQKCTGGTQDRPKVVHHPFPPLKSTKAQIKPQC